MTVRTTGLFSAERTVRLRPRGAQGSTLNVEHRLRAILHHRLMARLRAPTIIHVKLFGDDDTTPHVCNRNCP
jgi:hypothetical protein